MIIDGNSTDGSVEFLKTLSQPFNWISENDSGVYEAMNKGIDLAKGEWLYFLGDDDRLFENTTFEKVFKNKISSKTDILIGRIKYDFCEDDSIFIKKNDGIVSSSWSKKLWLKNSLHHQGMFYNKRLFVDRRYSLNYKILADYDLNLNLFKNGVKPFMIAEKVAVCGTDGLSKGYRWKMYREEIELKTNESSILLWPLFFLWSFSKYLVKKKI